jgi:hypothetical protein
MTKKPESGLQLRIQKAVRDAVNTHLRQAAVALLLGEAIELKDDVSIAIRRRRPARRRRPGRGKLWIANALRLGTCLTQS